MAYGSFLNDTGRPDEALEQWEKSRDLDPKNPAVWNNLAEVYVHRPPVTNIFAYLGKAIELAPREALYLRNLAAAVSLYRADAAEFYQLPDDQAVLRRALELYRKAREYDPANLPLATDLAQTFYFMKPTPAPDPQKEAEARRQLLEEGLTAWRDAEKTARDDVERQGIYLHMARYCGMYGKYAEGRDWLLRVDKPEFQELKKRIARSLDEREMNKKPNPAKTPQS
jgi:tetratricopeptide (TPR) repeat protein